MCKRSTRDERGSIAIAVIVILVASTLVLATVIAVERGLRSSRRAGDSANALQVADAGVNAAVQFIPTVPQTATSVGPIGPVSVGSGSYTYTATKVDNQHWNVTSTGLDQAGLQRTVAAQAVADPLFGRPLYIRATGSLAAGTILDSYGTNPTTGALDTCTKQGRLTVNDPSNLKFTGSGNQRNCQNGTTVVLADGTSTPWDWSIDGCEFPGDESALNSPIPLVNGESPAKDIVGSSRCPKANFSRRISPRITPQAVVAPKAGEFNFPADGDTSKALVCPDETPHAANTEYVASIAVNKIYSYASISLRQGCNLSGAVGGASEKPAQLFARSFDIGVDSGGSSDNVINPPAKPYCLNDYNNPTAAIRPPTGYCPGWPAKLRLNLIGNGTVTFRNKTRFFWGVINAPGGTVELTPSQLEVWGASISNSLSSSSQFSWHFDDGLLQEIGSGRFSVANWREEATP